MGNDSGCGRNKLREIEVVYQCGGNIMEYLRECESGTGNTTESISMAYDFQAGSYRQYYYDDSNPAGKNITNGIINLLAEIIREMGISGSLFDAGTGEATTLVPLLKLLDDGVITSTHAFDISWSRCKYAEKFCREQGYEHICLLMADMFNPLLSQNN